MIRAVSLLAMSGTFLMISPKLRDTVTGTIASVEKEIELYAPYSYIACAALILMVLMISMYRGAQAR